MKIHFRNYHITILDTNKPLLLHQLIANNRSRLADFFAGTLAKTATLEATKSYCQTIADRIQDQSYFPFIIYDQDQYIGLIDIKNIDWNIPKAEIGYFIDHHYEGQGIVSEGLSHLIPYLISTYNFKKLFCRISSKNPASARIAMKNNFELEGTIRCDYKTTAGELVDLDYYGLVM